MMLKSHPKRCLFNITRQVMLLACDKEKAWGNSRRIVSSEGGKHPSASRPLVASPADRAAVESGAAHQPSAAQLSTPSKRPYTLKIPESSILKNLSNLSAYRREKEYTYLASSLTGSSHRSQGLTTGQALQQNGMNKWYSSGQRQKRLWEKKRIRNPK
jgi:hypothetical protein